MADDTLKTSFSGKRVALGISGGIAAYKAAEVLRGLQRAGCIVRVAMSQRASEFITPLTFRALSGSHVIVDDYAPDNPDPIAHITFSQTVDLFVIAPATANIIAKFANGVADDFLTSTYLAATAPVLVAPAMNTSMWEHPATRRNIERLLQDGVHVIEPDAGEMACGTIGPGRLSEPERIVAAALEILGQSKSPRQDLAGERLLITTGATREELDPIRFISN
ncbi:MAG TPA: bifunctional phosphopantothenoylcysteine decarboxylase/phosphopantothenate--cysteine ligase CoaBC, partial [Pyrinomonadaceae bacterium]|nr:bifunctional phosphopantothenoylcysteine decarboxylase/phosphopantothenate--cysteine ligase CoaBC [Pyrinomonadaceae bacterium]